MYAPSTRYLAETVIERKRTLPGPAKILVRNGQVVTATDPVVEELIYQRHQLLDVASGLGVSPDRVDQLLQCKAGTSVTKGDLLAGPVGLTRRVMRAPQSGKIISIGHGTILMGLFGQTARLSAGVNGEIVDLISERGVVIRGAGALIQGAWGNGKIGQGMLQLLLENPDQELTESLLTDNLAGVILVSGYCRDQRVVAAAAKRAVKGMVLASMHPSLVEPAASVDFPILLVEGFGQHPLNSMAHEILTTHAGRLAAINAELGDHYTGWRPEMTIPKQVFQERAKTTSIELFAPGKKVRLIDLSHLGHVGELIDLIGDIRLPNGLTATAARIKLESGDLVDFPLANLEILV